MAVLGRGRAGRHPCAAWGGSSGSRRSRGTAGCWHSPALTGGAEQREWGAQRAAAGGRGGGAAPPGGDAKPEQRGHRRAGRPLPAGPATAPRGETSRDRPVSRSVVRALCGHGPAAQHRIAPRSSACCCRHHRRRILYATKYWYSCRRCRRLAPRRPQHPPLPAPLLPAPPRLPSPGSAARKCRAWREEPLAAMVGWAWEWSCVVLAPQGAGSAGRGSPQAGGRAAVAPGGGGGCSALPCHPPRCRCVGTKPWCPGWRGQGSG